MSKSPRRPAAAQTPDPAQIAAVRRAAKAGQAPQAEQRLASLRAAFPGFKPLLGLAWEVQDLLDDPMRATARAYEWHQAVPGSQAALEALYNSADQAGLFALQISAHRALQALGGAKRLPPLPEFFKADDAISHEHAEALDLGRMHLYDGNPQATAAVLRGVPHPAARNNLSVALFATGDVAAALQVAEGNWQGEQPNLFALERVVRWRCWTEGMDRCAGFAATLRQAKPDRGDHAFALVTALRFLDQTAAAHQAWKDAARAPYWEPGEPVRSLFDALRNPDAEVPGGPTQWFPSTWLDALMALTRQVQQERSAALKSDINAKFEARIDTCDAHADYLERTIDLGDAATRKLAREVLKRRADRGDSAALAALKRGLTRPAGTDAERMELQTWLSEQGLVASDERLAVWHKGALQPIRSMRLQIHGEPRPSRFPPDGADLELRLTQAMRSGALQEAMDLVQRLRRQYPQQPSPLANLAAIKAAMGHPDREIVELYRQALALDPDYLIARCGLADRLAKQGHQDEARGLLNGLLERRQEFHYSEYRSFMLAQRALAVAEGDGEAAQSANAALAELEREFPSGTPVRA